MNTKLIMTLRAIIMGATGIILSFASDYIISFLNLGTDLITLLFFQILGALYFGFAMLNWMNKGRPIGGIYNRPVAVANLCHFGIAGLALIKGAISNPDLPISIWCVAIVYIVLGIAFGIILFQQPISDKPNIKSDYTN